MKSNLINYRDIGSLDRIEEKYLIKNERLVLQHLIENARVTDLTIAKNIGISTQAVGKIRKKLEYENIIQGYGVILNNYAVGLHMVGIVNVHIPLNSIAEENEFKKNLIREINLMSCFKLNHGETNFLLILGFRNIKECEETMHLLQKKYPGMKIKDIQTTSWEYVWKNSRKDIYNHIIERKKISNNITVL